MERENVLNGYLCAAFFTYFYLITAIWDYAITDASPVDYVALKIYDPVLEVKEF